LIENTSTCNPEAFSERGIYNAHLKATNIFYKVLKMERFILLFYRVYIMKILRMFKSKKAEEMSFGMTEIVRWAIIIIAVIVIIIMIVYFAPKLANAVANIF
jgi:hypothetical protein